MPPNNQSSLERNRYNIIIGVVILFILVAGCVFYFKIRPQGHALTAAEIQALNQAMTSNEPETLSPTEKKNLEVAQSATSSETLAPEEKSALERAMSSK